MTALRLKPTPPQSPLMTPYDLPIVVVGGYARKPRMLHIAKGYTAHPNGRVDSTITRCNRGLKDAKTISPFKLDAIDDPEKYGVRFCPRCGTPEEFRQVNGGHTRYNDLVELGDSLADQRYKQLTQDMYTVRNELLDRVIKAIRDGDPCMEVMSRTERGFNASLTVGGVQVIVELGRDPLKSLALPPRAELYERWSKEYWEGFTFENIMTWESPWAARDKGGNDVTE